MASIALSLPMKPTAQYPKMVRKAIPAASGLWHQKSITHVSATLTEASLAIYKSYVLRVIYPPTRN